MRIAMIQSDQRAGARTQDLLEEAGHEVLHCLDSGSNPFPCRGVAGGPCPLDEGAVVAVSAPGSVPPEPQAGDVGLICALRRHLPVLVAVPDDVRWPGARLGLVVDHDVVAAVEQAAAAVLPVHTAAVLDEVRRVVGGAASATVTRSVDGLEIAIDLPEDVEASVAQAAAVRAQSVVRGVDSWAATIDVRIGAG